MHYTDGLTPEDTAISARVYAHAVHAHNTAKCDRTDYRVMLDAARSRDIAVKGVFFVHCWERNAYLADVTRA